MKKRQVVMITWLATWTIVPVIVFLYFRLNRDYQMVFVRPRFHFYIVSAVSIVAALCSTVIGWIGARLRNANVLFLALAFTSLFGFFTIHGLATPGFILSKQMTSIPSVASQLGLTTCAIWLLFSSLPSNQMVTRWVAKYSKSFTFGWFILLFILAMFSLLDPHIADWVPITSNPLKFIFALFTNALFLLAGERYLRQYRFAHFPIQMSVTYSVIWLCIAQAIIITTDMWTLAWWLYHVILLVATIQILFGIAKQYLSRSSIVETFRMMFSPNLMDRIHSSISPNVQALIEATETKDSYTAGHNLRVSMYALQLADQLKLSPEMLRALAQGGVVHDVGKIEIPSEILNKPGTLTAEERTVIERHPVIGYEMCKQLGFMKDELDVVRSHHERWDGNGYPDNLKGWNIPRLARILAVADVYDALTSERAYRKPWAHERALQFIVDHAGTQFDPECVNAWRFICESGNLVKLADETSMRKRKQSFSIS